MSERHTYHRFLCGCSEENGTCFPCPAHQVPHSQHRTPAPGCGPCADLLDEARELGAAFQDWDEIPTEQP